MVARPSRSWSRKTVFRAVEQELGALGAALRLARRRRGLTQADVARRLAVNIRVVAKLERGDPTVALGAFLQVLSLFGLLAGLARQLEPGTDVAAAMEEVRAMRAGASPPRRPRVFADEDMDF